MCCATCVLDVVWTIETADGHGEGQVETCCADGLGAVKDEHEALDRWTKVTGRLIVGG